MAKCIGTVKINTRKGIVFAPAYAIAEAARRVGSKGFFHQSNPGWQAKVADVFFAPPSLKFRGLGKEAQKPQISTFPPVNYAGWRCLPSSWERTSRLRHGRAVDAGPGERLGLAQLLGCKRPLDGCHREEPSRARRFGRSAPS
mgnify:CR=1 FL=1